MTNEISAVRRYIAISLLVLTLIISIGGSILLIFNWQYMKLIQNQGLLGLFLISIFAGSPIPIPTPSMILAFTMSTVYNPLLVALVFGFGNGLGNALVYLTGRGGLAFFKNIGALKPKPVVEKEPTRWSRLLKKLGFPRMREFAKKRAGWAVFVLSIYPNPILTPVIITMGAARYNFWNFLVDIVGGKTVQGLVLSYLGYFGLRSILHYLGVTLP